MTIPRRTVTSAWAVPTVALGAPAPRTAASCSVTVAVAKVERAGKSFKVTLAITTDAARTIGVSVAHGWSIDPGTVNLVRGRNTVVLVASPGRYSPKAFPLAWVAADGCRASGCVTVDTRRCP